tara:strand:- start:96 stop:467 length:372 start_codon:yes stop_codon:yes gene_type:complete
MAYKQSPGRMNMPKTGRGLDAPTLMKGSPAHQDERSGKDLDPKVQEKLKNFKAKQLKPKSDSERSQAEAKKQIDKIVDTTGKSPSVATSGRPTNVPYELHAKYDYHAKKGTTDKFLKEQGLNL